MFIRSERLFLRPAWPEDWEEMLARIADEAVVMNLARVPWPYSAEDARSFVNRPQERTLPHFVITLPTSAEPARMVGGIGLADSDGEVELGYWLARDFWGKGFATEAARAVVSLARTLGHKQLVSGHFIDNPATGRVLRKVGFVPTGRMRRRYCLARGGEVASVEHRLELVEPCNYDDEIAAEPMMRVA